MALRSRKGDAFFITEVVFILGLLFVFVVVFVVFVVPFMFTGTASVSAQLCYNTLTMKANAEDAIDGGVDAAHITDYEDRAWYNPKGIAERTTNFLGFTTQKDINDEVEGFAGKFKDALPTMCKTNEVQCIGSAEYVAECMYDRAAETYYALRGGISHTETDFNMYRMYLQVTSGSTVGLEGHCNIYIGGWGTANPVEDNKVSFSVGGRTLIAEHYPPTADTPHDTCNITFNYVDEGIMTLVQVSRCQQAEPNGPAEQICKCFYHYYLGYSVRNGLPNTGFKQPGGYWLHANVFPTQAGYLKTPRFKGCGYEPEQEAASGGVISSSNLIEWDATTQDIPRDTYEKPIVLYTRIPTEEKTWEVTGSFTYEVSADFVLMTSEEGGYSR